MTEHNAVPVAIYDKVARSFLMLTREDEKDGKTIWSRGSGVAVKSPLVEKASELINKGKKSK